MSIRPWLSVTTGGGVGSLLLQGRTNITAQTISYPNNFYWNINDTPITTLPKITFTNLLASGEYGIFAGMPQQNVGISTLDIDNPTSFSFGNSTFGYFSASSATVTNLVGLAPGSSGWLVNAYGGTSVSLRLTGTYTRGDWGSRQYVAGPERAMLNLEINRATGAMTNSELVVGSAIVPAAEYRGLMVYDAIQWRDVLSYPFDRLRSSFSGTYAERIQQQARVGFVFSNRYPNSRATTFTIDFTNFPVAMPQLSGISWAVRRNGSLTVRHPTTPTLSEQGANLNAVLQSLGLSLSTTMPAGWTNSWNATTRKLTINTDAAGLGFQDSFVVCFTVINTSGSGVVTSTNLLAGPTGSGTGYVTLSTTADLFTSAVSLNNMVNGAAATAVTIQPSLVSGFRYLTENSSWTVPRITAFEVLP